MRAQVSLGLRPPSTQTVLLSPTTRAKRTHCGGRRKTARQKFGYKKETLHAVTDLVLLCYKQRVPSMWGRLATCAAVGYRRRSAANALVGRLTIGRSLPSCPTRFQPVCNTVILD